MSGGTRVVALVVATCVAVLPTLARESDTVKSDLPLWSESHPDVWPRPFADEAAVGVGSIFWTGYWRRVNGNCAEPSTCESWLHLEIASVFHGAFSVSTGLDRSNLDGPFGGSAVIAELNSRGAKESLYAMQVGFLGGSEYLLLSAPTGSPVKRLTVLDARCEDAGVHAVKRRAAFDTRYLTSYCAIRDRDGLRMMARAAAARPPLATLEWMDNGE